MRQFKVFIAGSTTEVLQERLCIEGAIAEWNSSQEISQGNHTVDFKSYSYKSWSDIIDPATSNNKYNIFIKKSCDLIIFIIAGEVYSKTLEEFKVAYDSLHGKRRAPKIIVFNKKGVELNENAQYIRSKLSRDEKYWIDYSDNDELTLLTKEQLTKCHRLLKLNKRIKPAHYAFIVCLVLGGAIGFGGSQYFKVLKKNTAIVEENIIFIKTHTGLDAEIRKQETLKYLDSHYLPQRDSLKELVKNL